MGIGESIACHEGSRLRAGEEEGSGRVIPELNLGSSILSWLWRHRTLELLNCWYLLREYSIGPKL